MSGLYFIKQGNAPLQNNKENYLKFGLGGACLTLVLVSQSLEGVEITKFMGITKSNLFDSKVNFIADIAKGLAHPARVAIIQYVINHKTCVCNDLVNELPLSQSTIVQHLKELKAIGLIKGEIDGSRMNYCIDEKTWQVCSQVFHDLFSSYTPCNNNC